MLLLLLACGGGPGKSGADLGEPRDLVALVDPRIGTGGLGYGVGCAFPGPAWPFALAHPGPDTASEGGFRNGFYRGGGYHADDAWVQGFSQLHAHGIGLTAYGVVSLMPADGMDATKTTDEGVQARFSHQELLAAPGFLGLPLYDAEGEALVDVAITATEHTALYAFDWAEGREPTLILDLDHTLDGGRALGASVSLDATAGSFSGFMDQQGQMGPAFRVYFEGRVSRTPAEVGVWNEAGLDTNAADATGTDVGAWLRFEPGEPVAVRLALSLVDAEGAALNLEAEHAGFDVEAEAATTRAAWEELLSPVRVWGGEEQGATLFATALYHAALMPTSLTDADGRYPGFDGEAHLADGWQYSSDFSLWDTYRTAHPLYTLLWPARHEDMLRSLARMVEQGGALPRWPLATADGGSMVGTPAHIVFGEAWQKGLLAGDPDGEVLAEAALAEAMGLVTPYAGRPLPDRWAELGYYPSDEMGSSVSWTLEVALADAALAPVAEGLGEAELAATLADRAGNWANLWDPAVGFLHGRRADGTFEEDFDEAAWLDEYAEGNARQYLWMVAHDPEGLFAVLGGEQAALSRLEPFLEGGVEEGVSFFPGEWYWHGNEPDLHVPWLPALAGAPDRTRYWVDQVQATFYGAGPDGLAGNDDGGTLSAWYVFAALGFFPLAGTDRYVVGAPDFDRIELPFDDGTLTLVREGEGDPEVFTRDGEAWAAPDLRHADLGAGVTLRWTDEDGR